MEKNERGQRTKDCWSVPKNSKSDQAKSKGTIDLAQNCHGWAIVTFIDGGGATLKHPVNYEAKTMVAT